MASSLSSPKTALAKAMPDLMCLTFMVGASCAIALSRLSAMEVRERRAFRISSLKSTSPEVLAISAENDSICSIHS